MWNRKYPELSGSYPESANSKSKNPESGIGGKMTIGYALVDELMINWLTFRQTVNEVRLIMLKINSDG